MIQSSPRELKLLSRKLISLGGVIVFSGTIFHIIIEFVLESLTFRLSGYTAYFTAVSDYFSRNYNAILNGSITTPPKIPWPDVSVFAIVLCVILMLMVVVMRAGYEGFCLRVSRRERAVVRDIFNVFENFFRMFAVIMLRGVLITAGLILFVVPGIILYYRYRFAVLAAYDNPDMNAVACLRESARLTKSRKSDLFILDISFLGWMILNYMIGLFFFPILLVWINPYKQLAVSALYNGLTGREQLPEKPEEENPAH